MPIVSWVHAGRSAKRSRNRRMGAKMSVGLPACSRKIGHDGQKTAAAGGKMRLTIVNRTVNYSPNHEETTGRQSAAVFSRLLQRRSQDDRLAVQGVRLQRAPEDRRRSR